MDKPFLLLLFLLLSCSLPISISSYNVPAIFTFGDSIFDAGNNHFNKNCSVQADFPPYGSTFFHHPTGRFTNGRTVVDFICFTNVMGACCGDGPLRGLLQWEGGLQVMSKSRDVLVLGLLPSIGAHLQVISKVLWDGKNSTIRPFNLQTLASML
ncbi:hypothetical protein GH714_017675 [Hevea brasiliensis]|uniref:GDSL esterase/lipase n=1 Tax=Hevea brasiliensis TaxID=3981 RepID=A0A6A6MED5_HEVBR|nr:hypothetical protein GH714_017675 [Hevea brasiliensis]